MSSKSDIWMPIYIGDLLGDTQHLTNEQFGIYHKLFYHQWRHGHFSEEEMATIAGYAVFEGASSTLQADLKQAFSRVLAPLKELLAKDKNDLLYSRRCDQEKAQWFEKKRVFIERARKGGLAKARRRREEIAASSSASSVLEGMLEPCTSPVEEQEQKQKLPIPTLPTALPREGTKNQPEPAVESKRVDKAKGPQKAPTGLRTSSMNGNLQASQKKHVAVPRIATAGHSNKGSKPQNAPKSANGLEREVLRFWEQGEIPGFSRCPWTKLEDRALDAFLKANPDLDIDRFKQLLSHRAASEGINRADPPHKWLRSLIKYADGPLDKYGKPLKPPRIL